MVGRGHMPCILQSTTYCVNKLLYLYTTDREKRALMFHVSRFKMISCDNLIQPISTNKNITNQRSFIFFYTQIKINY
jgi:hypothetical protein